MDSIFNFVASWIVDVVLTAVFYWPGWIVLRVLTFGRYPLGRKQPHNVIFVSVIGLCSCVAALIVSFT